MLDFIDEEWFDDVDEEEEVDYNKGSNRIAVEDVENENENNGEARRKLSVDLAVLKKNISKESSLLTRLLRGRSEKYAYEEEDENMSSASPSEAGQGLKIPVRSFSSKLLSKLRVSTKRERRQSEDEQSIGCQTSQEESDYELL